MGEFGDAGNPVMFQMRAKKINYMLRFVVAIRILANETYC
jgi:hypothetical protein